MPTSPLMLCNRKPWQYALRHTLRHALRHAFCIEVPLIPGLSFGSLASLLYCPSLYCMLTNDWLSVWWLSGVLPDRDSGTKSGSSPRSLSSIWSLLRAAPRAFHSWTELAENNRLSTLFHVTTSILYITLSRTLIVIVSLKEGVQRHGWKGAARH